MDCMQCKTMKDNGWPQRLDILDKYQCENTTQFDKETSELVPVIGHRSGL